MIYLQITFCLLVIVSSVRLMPIADVEETETTEWTRDITTEEAAATTWLAPESLTKEEEIVADASSSPDNNNNNKGPATITTTEEPFNAVTDHDEPTAVWSPSQTVEIRLHPQSLRTEESKGSHQEHPTVAPLASQELPVGPQAQVISSTSMPTPSVAPSDDDLFGRRMAMEPQTHGSFGGQTGRLRSRDSVGTALRRAVTGSPAVQRLQQSTTRMASSLPVSTSGRDKAGPPATGSRPGRKIVGFGSLSTLSNAQRVNSKTAAALRKESFFKNRQSGHGQHGHGGDTPADTHMEPSPQWLYGTSKDTRKTVESFRLSNNERLLVLGLRDKVMTTSTASTHEAEIPTTTTTSKPEEMVSTTTTTTTFTTTTVHPPVSDATISATTETEAVQSTTTRPTIPQVDSAMQETNDVPAQIKDAAARETNDATPEIDHETSQQTHDKTQGQTALTEATVHPETLSTSAAVSSTEANPFTKHSASKSATAQIPLDVEGEPIKNLDNSPLDAGSSSKQELGVLSTGDDCFGADCNEEQETGLNMGQLDHGGFDQEAHRYLVEEKTHDGYIIGEFGVVSRSSDLRAVRYTAHPSIDPQLIQEMLRTFWLLKTGEKE